MSKLISRKQRMHLVNSRSVKSSNGYAKSVEQYSLLLRLYVFNKQQALTKIANAPGWFKREPEVVERKILNVQKYFSLLANVLLLRRSKIAFDNE